MGPSRCRAIGERLPRARARVGACRTSRLAGAAAAAGEAGLAHPTRPAPEPAWRASAGRAGSARSRSAAAPAPAMPASAPRRSALAGVARSGRARTDRARRAGAGSGGRRRRAPSRRARRGAAAPTGVPGCPEARRLTREGGAVDRARAGEQVAGVAPEVEVRAPVGGEAEELAHDPDRQRLAVGKDRRRAGLAERAFAARVADEVVTRQSTATMRVSGSMAAPRLGWSIAGDGQAPLAHPRPLPARGPAHRVSSRPGSRSPAGRRRWPARPRPQPATSRTRRDR